MKNIIVTYSLYQNLFSRLRVTFHLSLVCHLLCKDLRLGKSSSQWSIHLVFYIEAQNQRFGSRNWSNSKTIKHHQKRDKFTNSFCSKRFREKISINSLNNVSYHSQWIFSSQIIAKVVRKKIVFTNRKGRKRFQF